MIFPADEGVPKIEIDPPPEPPPAEGGEEPDVERKESKDVRPCGCRGLWTKLRGQKKETP